MRRWYIALAVAGLAGLYGCNEQPLETSCCRLLSSIEVTPPTATLAVGDTLRFDAVVRDENDVAVETDIAWDVETIEDDGGNGEVTSGLFTAGAAGSVYVTAGVGVLLDSALVTITP